MQVCLLEAGLHFANDVLVRFQLAAPATRLLALRGTRGTPFLEVARAAAWAQRTPAVFVPAEFYGSATQWSLSLGARIHAGPMRRRMGRYVLPAGARPSAFTASPTHP